MTLLLLVHNASTFHGVLRPALGACRRARRFAPARSLWPLLAAQFEALAQRGIVRTDESVLAQLDTNMTFETTLWRYLVEEVLLCAAVEVPELQIAPITLCRLLAPTVEVRPPLEQVAPVHQALNGTHDLTFAGYYYRPDRIGWNDTADAVRLADYLGQINPAIWKADDLLGLPGMADEEDRADELDLLREWFPAFRELYERVSRNGVIVCETL